MCTKLDTIKTGINIVTVKESNWKPHNTFNDSESIHLITSIVTGILLKPTSKNVNIANIVVNTTHIEVIICDPFTPTFLPKNLIL